MRICIGSRVGLGSHTEVVFNDGEDWCPVCKLMKKVGVLKAKVQELDKQVGTLEEEAEEQLIPKGEEEEDE